MGLLTAFLQCAEQEYAIDWEATRRSVADQLELSAADQDVLDPRLQPTYWCVPILLGSYLGSSRAAVVQDLQAFLGGCAIRHLLFEPGHCFGAGAERDLSDLLTAAYAGCRLGGGSGFEAPFEQWFSAKCRPWTVLLALGSAAIAADRGPGDPGPRAALDAIVPVYSLLQFVDDWHDRGEDLARGHWNVWLHAGPDEPLAAARPLLRGAAAAVGQLRPHLLRRALVAQLQDAVSDLTDILRTRDALGLTHARG